MKDSKAEKVSNEKATAKDENDVKSKDGSTSAENSKKLKNDTDKEPKSEKEEKVNDVNEKKKDDKTDDTEEGEGSEKEDESDKDGDKSVPLLDQPLQQSGTRERKKVQRFNEDFKEVSDYYSFVSLKSE